QTYQRALALDPGNARATAGLEALNMDRRHRALLAEAEELLNQGNTDAALGKVKEVLAANGSHREAQSLLRRIEAKTARAATPHLSAAMRKQVTLEFRDAPLRSVFEIISKQSGLNFMFDRDVPADLRTTVFVRDTSIENVIRFVLITNQLE